MNVQQLATLELIKTRINMGFDSIGNISEEVVDFVEDKEWEDEVNKKWIKDTIKNEYNRRVEESKTWNHPTDAEKLFLAFDQLCKEKIIALFCGSYAAQTIFEIHDDLRNKGIESFGACFIDLDSVEEVVDPEKKFLRISYYKVEKDPEVWIDVGKQVAAVLKEHGFTVKWNEKDSSIQITGIVWNKVYDKNESSSLRYLRVLELMK